MFLGLIRRQEAFLVICLFALGFIYHLSCALLCIARNSLPQVPCQLDFAVSDPGEAPQKIKGGGNEAMVFLPDIPPP